MQRHGNPVRLEDFALMHGLNGLLDGKSGLFQRFSQHPKVQYDSKTDLYSYKVSWLTYSSPITMCTALRTLLRCCARNITTHRPLPHNQQLQACELQS